MNLTDKINKVTDKINKAFSDYCMLYGLVYKGKRVADLTKEDIDIPTCNFPITEKTKGKITCFNSVSKKYRTIIDAAFRVELRTNKKTYLAVLWESTGTTNEVRLHYATDDSNYVLETKSKINWDK